MKVDDWSATDDASLIVTVGLFDSLEMSICLLMGADHCTVQGKGIIIKHSKNFVNRVKLSPH
jgi:hypothetical protein